MSRDRIRWGILGTGWINRRVLVGSRQTRDALVVAIASRDKARAEVFARDNGIPRAHGSYGHLLADPTIDAVYVALPNSLHHTWTMAALAAGKHVLCEKPYSRNPHEVDEAFDVADRAGLVLQEALMWRHTPLVHRVLGLLPSIGDLQAIRATFVWAMDVSADIRLAPDLDGGALMDVGCYCVSASRLFAGAEPTAVSGFATIGPTGVDVRFAGLLRFPGGVDAQILAGFTSDRRGLEAIGSRGSLVVPDPWHTDPAVIRVHGEEIVVEREDPYMLELEDMAAAIRGEKPPLLGRDDALGQARSIAALHEAATTGSVVSLTA